MAWSYDEALARLTAEEETPQGSFDEWFEDIERQEPPALEQWVRKLPKNVAKGGYLGALSIVNTADSFLGATSNIPSISANSPDPNSDGEAPVEQPEQPASKPLHESFPEAFRALNEFGEELQEDNTFGDSMTQAAAQFFLPFAGWLKVLGGMQKGQRVRNILKLGTAEGVAVGTSFEPDEARLAELIEFGRQMDNRYGEALENLSPDGSLLARYIDWQTADRENETEMEARFKNAIDSVAFTGSLASAYKIGAQFLKAGRLALAEGGAIAGTPAAQRGMVTFHTTPFRRRQSEFIDDVFSMERVGEGEGAAAFGHGLYFAENPNVAKQYKHTVALASTRRHFRENLPDDAEFEDVAELIGTDTFTPEQDELLKKLAKDDWLGFDFPAQAIDVALSRNLDRFDPSPALRKAVDNLTTTLDVDIPDNVINRFLRQDAQFQNQPDNVKQAILKAQDEFGTQSVTVGGNTTGFADATNRSGKEFYDALTEVLGSKKKASEWLNQNGVAGMEFLDAQSRLFTGQGGFLKPLADAARSKKPTRNFILFDPQQIASVKQQGQTVFEKGATQ
jgi:hypothetical protein